jgi:endo-1,4-beta-xylanase
LWNGNVVQTGSSVTVTNLSWNATIPPGGTVNFGFIASWSGSNPPPAGFSVNGVACSAQ